MTPLYTTLPNKSLHLGLNFFGTQDPAEKTKSTEEKSTEDQRTDKGASEKTDGVNSVRNDNRLNELTDGYRKLIRSIRNSEAGHQQELQKMQEAYQRQIEELNKQVAEGKKSIADLTERNQTLTNTTTLQSNKINNFKQLVLPVFSYQAKKLLEEKEKTASFAQDNQALLQDNQALFQDNQASLADYNEELKLNDRLIRENEFGIELTRDLVKSNEDEKRELNDRLIRENEFGITLTRDLVRRNEYLEAKLRQEFQQKGDLERENQMLLHHVYEDSVQIQGLMHHYAFGLQANDELSSANDHLDNLFSQEVETTAALTQENQALRKKTVANNEEIDQLKNTYEQEKQRSARSLTLLKDQQDEEINQLKRKAASDIRDLEQDCQRQIKRAKEEQKKAEDDAATYKFEKMEITTHLKQSMNEEEKVRAKFNESQSKLKTAETQLKTAQTKFKTAQTQLKTAHTQLKTAQASELEIASSTNRRARKRNPT